MHLVADRLKERRIAERYSQRALAKAAGVPYSALLNMEMGRVKSPKFSVIAAIAEVLGDVPSYFFDGPAVENGQAATPEAV